MGCLGPNRLESLRPVPWRSRSGARLASPAERGELIWCPPAGFGRRHVGLDRAAGEQALLGWTSLPESSLMRHYPKLNRDAYP